MVVFGTRVAEETYGGASSGMAGDGDGDGGVPGGCGGDPGDMIGGGGEGGWCCVKSFTYG